MAKRTLARSLLAILLAYIPLITISAQPTVGFQYASDTIALGAKGSSYSYQIPVMISALPSEDEPVIIKIIDLATGTAPQTMYEIEEPTLVFNSERNQVQGARINILGNYANLSEYDIHLMISIEVGIAKVEIGTFFLILKTPDNVQKLDPLTNYKLSIGANFDLIDGLSINSNYTDISVFHPQIWRSQNQERKTGKSFSGKERWGMDIWLYQSRSVSENQLASTPVNDTSVFLPFSDSIFSGSGTNQVMTRDNLGFYFSPIFRLNKLPTSDYSPMSIYVLGQLEFTRTRTFEKNPEISLAQNDPISNLSYTGYGGLGLLFHHSSKSVDLFLKLSSGITFFDHPVQYPQDGISNMSTPNPMYYQSQLRIQEKQFGLKLGADVRGFFHIKNQSSNSTGFYPVFTLFLAKEFSFSQIGRLFGPVGER